MLARLALPERDPWDLLHPEEYKIPQYGSQVQSGKGEFDKHTLGMQANNLEAELLNS